MGGDPAPLPPAETTKQMMEAYISAYPELMSITNAGAVPAAQAQLAAAQAVSPGMAALQSQLYQLYGPQLANTANAISRDQALAQAGTDLSVLQGPGSQLISTARALQRQEDPEFYASRALISKGLGDLVGSIDLNGGLSPGETEEMNRAVARENLSRGISDAPSQTAVLSNALKFGQAGYNRQQQAKSNLATALGVGTGFLPASRSGVDVFQVGTGRSAMPNAGDSKFVGVDSNLGQSAQNMGQNLLGQVSALTQQRNQLQADRRDSLDRFNQTWGSVIGQV